MSGRSLSMKASAVILVGGAIAVAASWPRAHHPARTTSLPTLPVAAQAVATSVFFGLMQLDCDGQNEPDASCNDELEYVNAEPHIDSLIQHGRVTVVTVTFLLRGLGSRESFRVRVRDGQVIGATSR